MKRFSAHSHSRRSVGFTLVELLVVIAIIAILAGVVLSAGNQAIKAALRAKAANLATQIQTAALNYYTEYSVYPDDTTAFPAGTDFVINDTDAANWGNMIQALCGNIKPSTGATATPTVTNARGIAFLTLKASDVDTHDAPLNPLPPDPKTHIYFNMAVDNDYNGVLGVAASSAVTTMPNFTTGTSSTFPGVAGGGTSTAGVAVWANCTGKPDSATANSGWWIHTY